MSEGLFINLKTHGAYNVRRYKIWKDIHKLEDLIDNGKCNEGYFIMITNDDTLIAKVPKENIDSIFDISNGKHPINIGDLYWNNPTQSARERYPNVIPIQSYYEFNYHDYKNNGVKFYYLVLNVKKQQQ